MTGDKYDLDTVRRPIEPPLTAHEGLDRLGVPEEHRIRRLANEFVALAYNEVDIGANPSSLEAGVAYLATQCDEEFQSVSQRQVGEIFGVTKSTIRKTYQAIARAVDV